MPFNAHALDQIWIDFLLILGFVLTGGSLIAVALCVLGGCLDAIERRRDGGLAKRDSPQILVDPEITGTEPASRIDRRELFPASQNQNTGYGVSVRKVI
jgi:hypothetical protein